MRNFIRLVAVASSLVASICLSRSQERQTVLVDVALVLAIDISGSVDPLQFEMQKQGYANAFRDAGVIYALESGPAGKIAVSILLWAGQDKASVEIPWTILSDETSSKQFADEIRHLRRFIDSGASTCMAGAFRLATAILESSPFEVARRVLDISGDGVDDTPRGCSTSMIDQRQMALDAGIIVNGLPIVDPDGRQDLDKYYRDNVIGGSGSFYVPAFGYEQFGTAIIRKLIREISRPIS